MTKSLMNYAMKKKRKSAPTQTRTEVTGVKFRRDTEYSEIISPFFFFLFNNKK